MVIHVKDEETDELVRTLAKLRGIGITAAIKDAVAEAIAADLAKTATAEPTLEEKLRPLLTRLDRLSRDRFVDRNVDPDVLWSEAD